MIDKIRKGNRVAGLIYYLFGPGKSDEHRDQHLVAGWRAPAEVEPPLKASGRRDFRYLINQLNAPLDAVGRNGGKATVWHCVLSASPEDPLLSDEQWNNITTEFMDQMGLAPRDDAAGVRWVAVRHGQSSGGIDHIHVVATLARQDGALPSVHNDYARARKACLAIEKRFGLHATAAADCTTVPRPSRAEREQARRNGRSEPPRVTLRRIVQDAAATAVSEDDFFARVREAGALVRVRNSTTRPGETTGYAVSLPAEQAGTRQTIWFSGGKLAPDLTLPKLRCRWERLPQPDVPQPGTSLDAKSVRAFLRSVACSAAEQATDQVGYFRRLDAAGVLVRRRYSEVNPDEITGYALALPSDLDENGGPNWYSGGKLSYRLTVPSLHRQWREAPVSGQRAAVMLSPDERRAIWSDVIRLTGDGAAELRRLGTTNPAAAADSAWATADALRASARAIGGKPGQSLRRAADNFDRAARSTYRVIPQPTKAGNGLRTASRLLAILGNARGPGIQIGQLIVQLIELAEETARLRLAQLHVHQAHAALTAADQLSVLSRSTIQHPQMSPRRAATTAPFIVTGTANDAVRLASADVPDTTLLPRPTHPQETHQPARSSANWATLRRKHEGRTP